MEKVISFLFIIFGILGILNTMSTLVFSNVNLGALFPGMVGIVLIFYGLFRTKILFFTQSGVGRYIRITVSSGILLFIITFLISVVCIVEYSSTQPSKNADAIIVLGAGLHGDKVSQALAFRLDEAFHYYKQNSDTIILVSGGQGSGEWVTEAYAMKKYLVEKGLPENKILTEDKSTNTYENFSFSKTILDEYWGNINYRIIYVTNDFHIFRAGMIANDAGFEAEGLASPSPPYLLPNFYIREYFSLIKYFVFGRFIS